MGPSFIEPLKSQGVHRVEDDAVIIGVKYVTKPGEQFVIRREAYQRILTAFKANGIDLVGRGVVVRVDDPQAGEHAVGFAAAQAIRSVLENKASADSSVEVFDWTNKRRRGAKPVEDIYREADEHGEKPESNRGRGTPAI